MDVRNLSIFQVRGRLAGQWVDIVFKNGKTDHCFFFDIDTPDESPYEKDDLIYNHSGSFDYGDVYLLEDIKSITPSKIQGRIAN